MVRLIRLLRILPVALACVVSVAAEAGRLDSGAADVDRGRPFGQGRASPAAPRRAPSSNQQDPPSFKWWHSERFKTELRLTVQQSTQIEEVFQATVPRLRTLKEDLDRHQALLSVLIKEGTAPEAQVAQQVDRVEAARSEISKVRTLMLFRMRRLLSAEQRAKMDELHQRWEQDRKEQDRKKGGRPPHQ